MLLNPPVEFFVSDIVFFVSRVSILLFLIVIIFLLRLPVYPFITNIFSFVTLSIFIKATLKSLFANFSIRVISQLVSLIDEQTFGPVQMFMETFGPHQPIYLTPCATTNKVSETSRVIIGNTATEQLLTNQTS